MTHICRRLAQTEILKSRAMIVQSRDRNFSQQGATSRVGQFRLNVDADSGVAKSVPRPLWSPLAIFALLERTEGTNVILGRWRMRFTHIPVST